MKLSAAAALRGSRLDDFTRDYLTPGILDFASGAPAEAAPPEFRIEAARAVAVGNQGYGDSAGLLDLRAAIAAHLSRGGFQVDADGVVITIGATGGLQAALLAIVEPGDEIAVPVPGYEPIFDVIRLAGAALIPVGLEPPSWTLRAQVLRRAFENRPRAIYVNQPANPTGRIFTPVEIEAIITTCLDRDLVVIEDSVYDEFYFTRKPAMIGSDSRMRDRVIRVGSFSKTYAIPGWRLGYAAASGALGRHVRRAAETMTGGPVAPLQNAILAAGFDVIDFPALRSTYRQRGKRVAAILSRAGFRAALPDGGIYIFAQCPATADVRELLSHGIAAMPGSFFYPGEKDVAPYARFCFARTDAQINALGSAMSRLDSDTAPACAATTERT